MKFVVFLLAALLIVHPVKAEEVDAVIITAVDASSSISAIQASAISQAVGQAIASEPVMNAINSGKHGRVAMLVFTWAEHNPRILVDWMIIDTKADAMKFSLALTYAQSLIFGDNSTSEIGYLTNLSDAMEFGNKLLDEAPFKTNRKIMNIIGDGFDNSGDEPTVIHNLILQDITKTVNYVVTDMPAERGSYNNNKWSFDQFERYLRGYVVSKYGFVLLCNTPKSYPQIFRKKFIMEIAVN